MFHKDPRKVFFLAPLELIAFVFTVTLICSRFMEPLALAIPILISYYGFIWVSVWSYGRKLPPENPLLKRTEFNRGFRGLSTWMVLWTVVYPFVAGIPMFIYNAAPVPWFWLLMGIPFAVINGPSEEIFWRLLLERAGREAGLSSQKRLWYSSIIFSAWHFIFVVFLFPSSLLAVSLITVLIMTFAAGFLWMMVYQRTGNIFSCLFGHAVLNVFMIWPSAAGIVLGLNTRLLH